MYRGSGKDSAEDVHRKPGKQETTGEGRWDREGEQRVDGGWEQGEFGGKRYDIILDGAVVTESHA